jgi:hypothetical protein
MWLVTQQVMMQQVPKMKLVKDLQLPVIHSTTGASGFKLRDSKKK